MRARTILTGLAAAGLLAAPAIACPPPPPFPPPPQLSGASEADQKAADTAWDAAHAAMRAEQDRAWALMQQARLFDEAKSLVLVRFDREDETRGAPRHRDYLNGQRLALLKPVKWVRGAAAKGSQAELQLAQAEDVPMCAQMPAHDAFWGKPGDVFLVYLSGDRLRQQDVLQGYALDRILEPRTLAVLTAAPE